jgi:hypothetical protein
MVVGNPAGGRIDRLLRLEDGIDVSGGAAGVVGERHGRTPDQEHLRAHALTVELRGEIA